MPAVCSLNLVTKAEDALTFNKAGRFGARFFAPGETFTGRQCGPLWHRESATLQLALDSLFVMKSPGTEDAMVANSVYCLATSNWNLHQVGTIEQGLRDDGQCNYLTIPSHPGPCQGENQHPHSHLHHHHAQRHQDQCPDRSPQVGKEEEVEVATSQYFTAGSKTNTNN
jgi:hypothetical protein